MNDSIEYIRIQWTHYFGVLRTRFIPDARCLETACGSEAIHLAQNSMIIPISTAPITLSLSTYHETWFLRPDWSSLRPCGFQAGNGNTTVVSVVDQKDPPPPPETRQVLAHAAVPNFEKTLVEADWDAKVLVGFEIEFVLLDGSDKGNIEFVEAMAKALEKSCIKIYHFHAELEVQLEIAVALNLH